MGGYPDLSGHLFGRKMSTSRKRRLSIVAFLTIAAVGCYVVAYFACVSVRFSHAMTVKEPRIQSAYAYYKTGPLSQDFAQWFFEPARLCDEHYFRSRLWADRQHVE